MEFDQGSLNARLYDRVCCAISSDGFTHLHAALLRCDGRDYYNNIYDYNIIVIISSAVDDDYRHKKTRYIHVYIISRTILYDIVLN